jgi:ribosomal protein L11 methyltransferase
MIMEWLEVSVTAENEAAEAVAEVLSRYAYRGVIIEAGPEGWNVGPVVVRAYLPADEQLRANKRRVDEALGHLNQISPVSPPLFRSVVEEDWAEAWKQRLTVLHVGQHIVIRPSWLDHTPASEDVVIRLDPGMAFGTGLHPTTQMCLGALEEMVRAGVRMLDIGTGSGILAIAAVKLGAAHVLAVDNDPVAVKVAKGNVVANGVQDSVKVMQGSLAGVSDGYDLVVVNIVAKVIVDMMREGLAKQLCPGGILVAAGIIADQAPEVVEALEQNGLALIEQRQTDDWICLIAGKG